MKQDICYHRAVPHELYHRSTTQTIPQEYHTLVTTGRYYMLMLLHDKCMYIPHVPQQYHTLVTTRQCHTLVTTEQYHMTLPQDRLPHLLPQYHTESVWYSDTMHTGLIGILPQRSDRHYHMDHIDIVPHRSDRLAMHPYLIYLTWIVQQLAIHVWSLWYITT